MAEPESTVIYATGLEYAFVGIGQQFTEEGVRSVAVYNYNTVVARMAGEFYNACGCQMVGDCDHIAEAIEYAEFNILGAYVGAGMPVFLKPLMWEEWQELEESGL